MPAKEGARAYSATEACVVDSNLAPSTDGNATSLANSTGRYLRTGGVGSRAANDARMSKLTFKLDYLQANTVVWRARVNHVSQNGRARGHKIKGG